MPKQKFHDRFHDFILKPSDFHTSTSSRQNEVPSQGVKKAHQLLNLLSLQ
jgi:hypothetical protein